MHIISKFVLWTLAPKTDMSLKMMLVAILTAICMPYSEIRFATPEVAICPEIVVLPALSAGNVFTGERLKYLPEYLVQPLSVCMPLLMQQFLWNIAVLDRKQQKGNH